MTHFNWAETIRSASASIRAQRNDIPSPGNLRKVLADHRENFPKGTELIVVTHVSTSLCHKDNDRGAFSNGEKVRNKWKI